MKTNQLEKYKTNADMLAARDGKEYAVVDLGGYYQIWPKSMIDKNRCEHVYVAGAKINDWDDLLS